MKIIRVANEFSPFPAGRYANEGPFSGEIFREEILVPALKSGEQLIIDLDGGFGYGSSFLEESFGGLIRSGQFGKEIIGRIEFISEEDPFLIDEVLSYINDALKESSRA